MFQLLCDDVTGLKFSPILYPRVSAVLYIPPLFIPSIVCIAVAEICTGIPTQEYSTTSQFTRAHSSGPGRQRVSVPIIPAETFLDS